MQESVRLTILGMVSGLLLPESVNELHLNKARIFRNPAATREPGGPPALSANTALYSGEGKERHLVGEVATYLIESEIDSPGGQYGRHTRIQGTGGVIIRTPSNNIEGITLTTGTKPHSSAAISIPIGEVWDAPSLMQQRFDIAILPLRLLSKARILTFPIGIISNERKQEILKTDLNRSCPEPSGLIVKLSEDDCRTTETFCKKLAKVDLAKFEVPIWLFSRSFYKADTADRSLDLIITLESLLSESPESLRYKIAFRYACLTANDEDDQWKKFDFTKKVYDCRNKLVHGNKRALGKAREELQQNIEQIEDMARKCLTLACLLEIDKPILPSGKYANMRKEESIDEYILTNCLAKKGRTPLDSFSEVGKLWKSYHPV